jgi:hypothetical protein
MVAPACVVTTPFPCIPTRFIALAPCGATQSISLSPRAGRGLG